MMTRPILFLILAGCALLPGSEILASQDLVLVEVNGEPITGADLEAMIMEAHAAGLQPEQAGGMVPRLLEKAIRDRLILQDAFAMGMGEDPAIVGPIEDECRRRAISMYARSRVELPEVSEEEIREYFEDYYHKIQIRQISQDTPEECLAALERIQSGEVTMGTLATQISTDPLKMRGGLDSDRYWEDVEFEIRDVVGDLQPGDYSAPFPYKGRWTFLRVESRTAPDEAEYGERRAAMEGVIRDYKYKQVWKELVAEHVSQVDVQVNESVLDRIREDEDLLYRGEFRTGTDEPVLAIDPGTFLSEERFRVETSKLAMEMGTSTFEEILERSLKIQTEQLVLAWFAAKEGFLEHPEVREYYRQRVEAEVLSAYLDENIAQRISFDREEYEQFYEEHGEEFRGPDEVRLSILTSGDRAVIDDAATRLSGGADFEYVRSLVEGRDATAEAPESSWSPIEVFSDDLVAAIEAMEVGKTSAPIPYGRGWLILRLDGRRPGSIPPIEDVDSQIRKALYFRVFNRLLDEHLARLEEASEIVRHQDRIEEWARSES